MPASSRSRFETAGRQPPGVRAALRARRREPVSAAETIAIAGDPEGLGRRVRVELYRRFGRFPTESSEHSGRVRAVVHVPRRPARALPHPGRRVHPVGRATTSREYERNARSSSMPANRWSSLPRASSPPVHHAMGDRQDVGWSYGNVRNAGLIDNLPAGDCVEVPCRVDAGGRSSRLRSGARPSQCAALNRTFLNVVELHRAGPRSRSPRDARRAGGAARSQRLRRRSPPRCSPGRSTS